MEQQLSQTTNLSNFHLGALKSQIGEQAFLDRILELDGISVEKLLFDWETWARGEQLEPPGNWSIWIILAGRGWGKTRVACEWVRRRVKSRKASRIALISQSAADARDVLIEGEAGLLAIHPKDERPAYYPSKRRVVWPNGAIGTIFTAEDPDQLRGPSHDTALFDELAAFRNVEDVWSNAMFGLRLGDSRALVATTPRPIPRIKEFIKQKKERPGTIHITSGTTYENLNNLSAVYHDQIIKPFEGTRRGRQELNAEILEDIEGALWTYGNIEKNRRKNHPLLKKIAVAVDPSVGSSEEIAETGIMVGGLGEDGHGYLLADLTMRGRPKEWADRVIRAYTDHEADFIIAEKNNGGQMVEDTIRSAMPRGQRKLLSVRLVWASRGKLVRAEPVSALDEKGMLHIVGSQPQLEDELCTYEGSGDSPNRLDAYVWLFSYLMVKKGKKGGTWGQQKRRGRRGRTA